MLYTDIYALGATLYHALVGELPVEATDRVAGQSLKPLPKGIPEGLEGAITRALGLRVEDRPQTTEVFLDILREGVTEGSSTPYFFVGKKYTTPKKLAYGLANNWNLALEELHNENLRKWVFRGARDLDLGIFLEDLKHENVDLDVKLFKLLNRLNPQVINYKGYSFVDKTDLLKIAQEARQNDLAKEVLISILEKDVLSMHPQALHHGFLQLEQLWKSEIKSYNKLLEQESFSVAAHKDAEAILLTALISKSVARDLHSQAKLASTDKTMKRSWFVQLNKSTPSGQLAALTLAPIATEQTEKIRFKNRLFGASTAVVSWLALNLLGLTAESLIPINIILGFVIGFAFGVILHTFPDVSKGVRRWWKTISLSIFGGSSVWLFILPDIKLDLLNPLLDPNYLLISLVLLIIFVFIGVTC